MFRLAHGILIAHHQRRANFVTELQQMMLWVSPQNKTDAAFSQPCGNVGNSLVQKTIVPQVAMRVKRYRREKDNARLLEKICSLYGNFKRRIIQRSLRSLHPVNHAAAAGIRSAATSNRNARISRKPVKVEHTPELSQREKIAAALSPNFPASAAACETEVNIRINPRKQHRCSTTGSTQCSISYRMFPNPPM
jgi:hypothetical protein